MVVSVSVYSQCPRIPCEEKRLDMWRSNFRCRNHRHDGRKARDASFTSLTGFQSITLKVFKLSILTVQVSKTALFLRHGIERMGINTFFKSNTVSFETSLALQVEETSTCCLVACKISTFLLWLAAPKCHGNKGQCPHHYYHNPNPDQPQADSMGLTFRKEWRKTHENTWSCWNNKIDQQDSNMMLNHCRLRTMIHLDLHLQP